MCLYTDMMKKIYSIVLVIEYQCKNKHTLFLIYVVASIWMCLQWNALIFIIKRFICFEFENMVYIYSVDTYRFLNITYQLVCLQYYSIWFKAKLIIFSFYYVYSSFLNTFRCGRGGGLLPVNNDVLVIELYL